MPQVPQVPQVPQALMALMVLTELTVLRELREQLVLQVLLGQQVLKGSLTLSGHCLLTQLPQGH